MYSESGSKSISIYIDVKDHRSEAAIRFHSFCFWDVLEKCLGANVGQPFPRLSIDNALLSLKKLNRGWIEPLHLVLIVPSLTGSSTK